MADNNINPPILAFDETGELTENFIPNEEKQLANMNVRAGVPKFGAFYTKTFVMRDANNQLVDKTRYQFGMYKKLISEKIGKEICACFVITDPTVVAPVYIDYHAVGGPYGTSNELILELFNKLNGDDRPVSWPNILGKPEEYRPAAHLEDIGNMYGAEYWVAALERLTDAILMGDSASHDEIFRRIDENKNAANDAIADLQNQINAHLADTNNPHKTSAAQTGAYSKEEIDAKLTAINNNLAQNFVKKDVAENLALTYQGNQIRCFVAGAWRTIWPAQWV